MKEICSITDIKGLNSELLQSASLCNYIRCIALIGKYKMGKLYIILSVINKSVYLTGISKITSI